MALSSTKRWQHYGENLLADTPAMRSAYRIYGVDRSATEDTLKPPEKYYLDHVKPWDRRFGMTRSIYNHELTAQIRNYFGQPFIVNEAIPDYVPEL